MLKNILQIGGAFFLTRGGSLSILESIIMYNDIKYLWVYSKLPASLMLSFRRMAICFKFHFFMDKR